MVAGCGPKIAKICLFVFNFTLWLCGIVLIGGGSYVAANYNDYVDLFADDTILVMSWIAIGIGIFTFIVGFSGCCGAMKESSCLLKLYFTFVLLIVLAEATLGILTFVYSDDIEQSLMEGMQKAINETYGEKEGATDAVDEVQKLVLQLTPNHVTTYPKSGFDCCGAKGYQDYMYSEYLQAGLAVPESCCFKNNTVKANCTAGEKGQPIYPDRVWPDGCVSASKETIKDHYFIIGAVAFGLLIFEILTMVFACCVINGINNDYERYA